MWPVATERPGSGNSALSEAWTAEGNRGDTMDFRDWPFPPDTKRRLAAAPLARPGETQGEQNVLRQQNERYQADPTASRASGLVGDTLSFDRPRYLHLAVLRN